MRSSLLLLFCWWCVLPLRGADFDAANQLYDQGKFAEAKAGYAALMAAGERSANLFYNLGNTNHRLGAPGDAVLDYKRALTLDPGHPEAKANLDFERAQTGAVPWPLSWIDRLFPVRWADALALAGAIAGWVAIFLFTGIFFTPRRDKSGLWFGFVVALLIASYGVATVCFAEQDRALAIVTAKSAEVHLAPAESSTAGSVLPAGSEVRVLSERGDWVYCALPMQGRGWLPAKAIERVRAS